MCNQRGVAAHRGGHRDRLKRRYCQRNMAAGIAALPARQARPIPCVLADAGGFGGECLVEQLRKLAHAGGKNGDRLVRGARGANRLPGERERPVRDNLRKGQARFLAPRLMRGVPSDTPFPRCAARQAVAFVPFGIHRRGV